MKLYLIGNGFDCYLHGMPTQYYNFRSYIVSKFPGCEEYSDLVPSGIMMPKGDIRYDEEAYGVPSEFICHIHGEIGSDVVLGHGDDREIEEHFSSWGSEQSFSELKRCLRKDTKRAISSHREFFEKLGKVTQIYSYGFSFAAVDMVYIDEICKHIDPEKTVWWFNTYTWENEQEFVEKIRQYGFLVKHEKRW